MVMAKCFSYDLPEGIDTGEMIDKAKVIAEKNGAVLDGDSQSGIFHGHGVEGDYKISNNTINITVNKKPFIAPWKMVASQLEELFTHGITKI